MIKINLGKKKKAGGGGGSSKVFGFDIDFDFSKLFGKKQGDSHGEKKGFDFKNSPLVKLVIAGLIVHVVQSQVDELKKEALEIANTQIAAIEKQTGEVQAKLAQVRGFEKVKNQLEEDEKVIRTKLEVINKLLQTRNSPSKMMLYMADKIPPEVWLTDLSTKGEQIKITGATMGFSEVSDFLKALSESSFFEDISLTGIQESQSTGPEFVPGQNITDTTAMNRIQNFEITAKRRLLF